MMVLGAAMEQSLMKGRSRPDLVGVLSSQSRIVGEYNTWYYNRLHSNGLQSIPAVYAVQIKDSGVVHGREMPSISPLETFVMTASAFGAYNTSLLTISTNHKRAVLLHSLGYYYGSKKY